MGGLIIHSGHIIHTKWYVNCFNRPWIACAFYIVPGAHRAGEAGEGACNQYKQQNSNMYIYIAIA